MDLDICCCGRGRGVLNGQRVLLAQEHASLSMPLKENVTQVGFEGLHL